MEKKEMEKKMPEAINDDELDNVAGGAINVFCGTEKVDMTALLKADASATATTSANASAADGKRWW